MTDDAKMTMIIREDVTYDCHHVRINFSPDAYSDPWHETYFRCYASSNFNFAHEVCFDGSLTLQKMEGLVKHGRKIARALHKHQNTFGRLTMPTVAAIVARMAKVDRILHKPINGTVRKIENVNNMPNMAATITANAVEAVDQAWRTAGKP